MRYRFRLKSWGLGAILQSMAAARLAAVLLVVFATDLAAQGISTGEVVITVIDSSGAFIPGARIGITQLPSVIPNDSDWLHYALTAPEQASTRAGAYGEATVGLAKGSYAVSIAASAFKRYFEKIEVRGESHLFLRATLALDQQHSVRGDCMACGGPEILLESTSLNIFIPLEPLQALTLKAVRSRRL